MFKQNRALCLEHLWRVGSGQALIQNILNRKTHLRPGSSLFAPVDFKSTQIIGIAPSVAIRLGLVLPVTSPCLDQKSSSSIQLTLAQGEASAKGRFFILCELVSWHSGIRDHRTGTARARDINLA